MSFDVSNGLNESPLRENAGVPRIHRRRLTLRGITYFTALLLVLAGSHDLLADDGSAAYGSGEVLADSAAGAEITSAAVLKFAQTHHPELARLLKQLRENDPKEFQAAVAELRNRMVQLKNTRERRPQAYQGQLNRWKLDSRIRLLAARWMLKPTASTEAQLRKFLRQRREVRIDSLQKEKERLAERLEAVEQQLRDARKSLEADLESDWNRLTRKASGRNASLEERSAESGKENPDRAGDKQDQSNTRRKTTKDEKNG